MPSFYIVLTSSLTRAHSYHSARTLLCMKKFRMGRVHEPWTNLEPPIRRPDYYTNLALRKENEKEHAVAHEKPSRRTRSVDLGSVRLLHSSRFHSRPPIPG
jgi:delta8-fatty-acid desaturase